LNKDYPSLTGLIMSRITGFVNLKHENV
jgi:hypothetical protein